MNANTILTEDMTLEQKLEAIDKAMAEFQAKHLIENPGEAPLDPSSLTICDGCE